MTDRERDFRDRWQDGPTGTAPTTEAAGDPEAVEPRSGGEEGAAAGAAIGSAVAGPVGFVAGGVLGAAAGAAAETADSDSERGYGRRAEGTGPIDPIYSADDGHERDNDVANENGAER